MKPNKEILDLLGKTIVDNCYDGAIGRVISVRKKTDPPLILMEQSEFLKSLSNEQFEKVKKMVGSTVELVIFELFNILDEKPNYKLIYEENEQQVNINKISEMLKAELFIENGWIERFSKFKVKI